MDERRSDDSLEPMVEESLPLLDGHDRAVKQNSSLGEDLKRARTVAGHSLEDVSEVLRIRLTYLEYLESGKFDELPGLTYAVGFLRSYSAYLGLDSDTMVTRLKQGSDGTITKPNLSFHVPNREISRPRPILIFIVLLLAGIAYGGWYLYSTQGQIANELVSDVSTTLTEVAGFSNDDEVMVAIASQSGDEVEGNSEAPIKSSKIVSDPLTEDEKVVNTENEEVIRNLNNSEGDNEVIGKSNLKPNDIETASVPDVELSQTSVESSNTGDANNSNLSLISSDTQASDLNDVQGTVESQANTGTNIDSDDSKVHGEENVNARIIITATEDSWIEILGPGKELIFTRILRNGDIYRVPNSDGLKMITGNARKAKFIIAT